MTAPVPCGPDCPALQVAAENERLRGLLLKVDPWALDEPPLNRPTATP